MRGAIESAAPRRGEQGVLDATMERCETPSPSHAATQTGKRSWASALIDPSQTLPGGPAHSVGRCALFSSFRIAESLRLDGGGPKKMLVASSQWVLLFSSDFGSVPKICFILSSKFQEMHGRSKEMMFEHKSQNMHYLGL